MPTLTEQFNELVTEERAARCGSVAASLYDPKKDRKASKKKRVAEDFEELLEVLSGEEGLSDSERAKRYKAIGGKLGRGAKLLLNILKERPAQALVRTDANTMQLSLQDRRGLKNVKKFSNDDVRQLIKHKLVTAKKVGKNVGTVEVTQLGKNVTLHYRYH